MNPVEAFLILCGAAFAAMVCGAAFTIGIIGACRWMSWVPIIPVSYTTIHNHSPTGDRQ
jgi:hypothetical protein